MKIFFGWLALISIGYLLEDYYYDYFSEVERLFFAVIFLALYSAYSFSKEYSKLEAKIDSIEKTIDRINEDIEDIKTNDSEDRIDDIEETIDKISSDMIDIKSDIRILNKLNDIRS